MPRFHNASLPRAWLQLLRAPNLLTVPGDPLAGFLLAAGEVRPEAWTAMAASLCFYCAGLLTNDLADLEIDRAERPERPLPSGQVKKRTVLIVATMLFLAGELLCSLLGHIPAGIGLVLIAAILAYNLKLKKISILGPLNIGFCRGLSMILGVSAAIFSARTPQYPSVMAPTTLLNFPMMAMPPLILTLYIAVVTHLARREMETKQFGLERWAPLGLLIVCLTGFVWLWFPVSSTSLMWKISEWTMLSILFWPLWFAIFVAIIAGMKLGHAKDSAPAAIGLLISNLLFIQAFFAWPMVGLVIGNPLFFQITFMESGGGFNPWVSLCLLPLWPLNRLLARRFYAS